MVTRTLVRGLNVIEVLATAQEEWLGTSTIADRTDLDKATVSRILYTLVTTGYATQGVDTRKYRLTGKLQALALNSMRSLDLRTVARPHLRELLAELDETVHLGVMEDCRIIYLDKLESSRSIQLVSAVGQTMPLYSTALGKAILSRLPQAELEEIILHLEFTPRTERTITDPDRFREEIERVRQRGYSTDDRENEPGGACVAAAIIGANGRPVGAISVAGPDFRVRDHFTTFGRSVKAAANAIARELGGTMDAPA